MPRAVLFDLDGTLHDRAATLRGWLAGHVRRFGLPEEYAGRFTVLDDLGYRPKAEVFSELVAEFGLGHGAQELLDDYRATLLDAPCSMPHAAEVLTALRSRGVRTAVVTNGLTGWVEAQRRCIERLGLAPLLNSVLDSVEVGLSKPDPALYRLALKRLGVAAADAWFVGDSPRNDVWGPQQVGLRAAYLPTGHPLGGERPDAMLRDLRGVLELP
ncbi:HAD family hydrolase [uncultured Deinococcus sp.]|uniref:HAD family hydrolase n=1 Tax=uncultured Deinococcus sp. TaxID=158789 RepID=UPI002584DA4A|nr:HAD family hydrolase [uncultured Deinococcus sp.]